MAFINPMSFLLLTISNEIVLETTTVPKIKTNSKTDQMKVSKNTRMDDADGVDVRSVVTSNNTVPNRKRNVVEATTLEIERRARAERNGLRLRSCDA
jgi:hypothetical protein